MATVSSTPSETLDPLDTTVRLVTPERIAFEYPLAGPFRRAVSYCVDMILITVLMLAAFLASLALTLGSTSGLGPALVAFFVIYQGYGAFCEGVFNGQTLGKHLLGLRVVSDQGVPITGAQAVLRNLVGAVDGLIPFIYLPGLSCMLLTRKFQRLGDLAAGTMVVVEERRRRVGVIRLREPAIEAVLPWLPMRIAAGPELARALSDYVRCRRRFSRSRLEQMAEPLARPLRKRFTLPPKATSDAILCAVYHRVFLGD